MILCNSWIYVHIPRTGGTSLRTAMLSSKHLCYYLQKIDPEETSLRSDSNLYDPHAVPPTALPVGFHLWTIVRNPWDRFVSWYIYQDPSQKMSFGEFLTRLWESNPARRLQSSYLNGRRYDFIGQFERLSEDWSEVSKLLNVSKSLPHLNSSEHSSYRDYYNPYQRDLVAKAESHLISRFCYEF